MTGILYILIVIKVASICNMLQKGWTARDMAVNRKMHVISRTLREAEEVCREIWSTVSVVYMLFFRDRVTSGSSTGLLITMEQC